MSDEYTPSDVSVKIAFTYVEDGQSDDLTRDRESAFDRWLAAHDEAVRAEEREKTLRNYAQNRYLAFLEHPEVPWHDQPEGTARHYARVAADMIAEADWIRAQGKEQS